MENVIFYFSGTGNSYFVAKSVAAKISGNTTVAPLLKAADFEVEKYSTVGFVFPVHYIHAPEIVLRKLRAIPLACSKKVFAVATRGGSWGYALADVRAALSDGITLQEYHVKMPGNYILEYSALAPWSQKQIFKKAEKRIEKIVASIEDSNQPVFVKPNTIARLAKNTVGEKIESFSILGADFFTTNNCVRCMQCVAMCPVNNITVKDESLVWGDVCTQCMACIQWCPRNAISHPLLKDKRKRYTHPGVTAKQIEAQNTKDS